MKNVMDVLTERGFIKQTVYGEETALWSAVPKSVIKKYCESEELKRKALYLWKKRGVARTMFEKRDRSIKHKINALKRYWYSVKTFKKYYKNKNGSD